jgi:hypothetical protein
MQVALTWSVQLANATWTKVEIGVDEGDLARILVAHGATSGDPWGDIADLQGRLPTSVAYNLLSTECERLMLAHQITHFPESMDTPENRVNLRSLTVRIQDILASHLPQAKG